MTATTTLERHAGIETHKATALEALRDQLGLRKQGSHVPQWRFEPDQDERFLWCFDGDRGVALINLPNDEFELRCEGPSDAAPPAVAPRHFHTINYMGLRTVHTWRLHGMGCGALLSTDNTWRVEGDVAILETVQQWGTGAQTRATVRFRYDAAWDRYVADLDTHASVARVSAPLEYANLLPAGIGDTRPGLERYSHTFWLHPDKGPIKMGKNPVWWTSVEAQDNDGIRRIAPGGYIGFGAEPGFNPVMELIRSTPTTGAVTCCNLQDEHILANIPPSGAAPHGWHELSASCRVFSVPQAIAQHILEGATELMPNATAAWKMSGAAPWLPRDMKHQPLPGSPFRGLSDWSKPIPWDRPYNGMQWSVSTDPRAALHWDRTVGRAQGGGSIRLRGDKPDAHLAVSPRAGHTIYTKQGKTYRLTAWVKTQGDATAWIDLPEILYRHGDSPTHESPHITGSADWTKLETSFTSRGDAAPFTAFVLHCKGQGQAWFTDLSFEEV